MGEAYINSSRKLIDNKKFLSPCDVDKCKFKCTHLNLPIE